MGSERGEGMAGHRFEAGRVNVKGCKRPVLPVGHLGSDGWGSAALFESGGLVRSRRGALGSVARASLLRQVWMCG